MAFSRHLEGLPDYWRQVLKGLIGRVESSL